MATADEPRPRAVVTSKAFQRDAKRLRKRGKDMERLRAVVDALRLGQRLEPHHRDHALSGQWQGFRDCHIDPDWILIYQLDEEAVYLTRMGTHSDLFR
jgi:mRNA interferase YafQ